MPSTLDTIYNNLNTKQKEVVDALYGSYMVVAGPGTGKTQVLAARTAKILESTDVLPENILITTFTDAGVIAIKKRLQSFIGAASYKVRVSTIHGFSMEIIESYPEYFLKYRGITHMDDLENFELVEQILEAGDFPQLYSIHQPTYWIKDIVQRIKNLREEAVTPEMFLDHIDSLHEQFEQELSDINPERAKKTYASALLKQEKKLAQMLELQRVYQEYQRIKRERGKYDFVDMILYVAQEITENDLLASQLSEQYQFVMVDEFQDLSNAQNQVITGLLRTSDLPNILTVGDDDQSIYRFQGANLGNMLHFSQKFENTKIIVLDVNYRSGQVILDTAKNLIEKNTTRITSLIPNIQKPLVSVGKMKSQVRISNYPNQESEHSGVITRISELLDSGISHTEIAILVKKNAEIITWTNALESHGIPVTSRQKYNLFDTEEFRLVQYLIEIIAMPKVPDFSLIELMRIGIFGNDRAALYRITKTLSDMNWTRIHKLTIFDMLQFSDTLETLLPDSHQQWIHVGQTLLELRSLPQSDIIGVIQNVLKKLDIEGFIQKNSGFVGLSRVYKILQEIKDYTERRRVFTLKDILDLWKRMEVYGIALEEPELDSKKLGVQIMTAHQSKGLEYECVFIPGVLNGAWGNTRNTEKLKLPESITGAPIESLEKDEEERRLFFVGLTRAKSVLEVSFPASIRGTAKIASEFIHETGISPVDGPEISDYHIVPIQDRGMFRLKFENEELLFMTGILKNYRLSPTHLNDFLEDPKIFFKKVVLKYPFEDNPYFIFGRCYHEALEKFFILWKKDSKKPTCDELIAVFTSAISRAILTPAELEDAKKRGAEGLRGWYELQGAQDTPPAAVEYSLRQKNIIFEGVPLTGNVDRIDMLPNQTLRIIDYKTGNVKSMNELMGIGSSHDINYYRQLMFYRRMISLDTTWSKYSVEELRVDFVEGKNGEYKNIVLPIDLEQYEAFGKEIQTAWDCISRPEWWIEYFKNETLSSMH